MILSMLRCIFQFKALFVHSGVKSEMKTMSGTELHRSIHSWELQAGEMSWFVTDDSGGHQQPILLHTLKRKVFSINPFIPRSKARYTHLNVWQATEWRIAKRHGRGSTRYPTCVTSFSKITDAIFVKGKPKFHEESLRINKHYTVLIIFWK